MSEAVRFYFDNHLPGAVANELLRRGVDVLTSHRANRSRFPDDELLRLATAEGRAVVSEDEDFLTHAADFLARGESFAGVVYCDPARYFRRPGLLILNLLTLHGVYTAADMHDRVEYL